MNKFYINITKLLAMKKSHVFILLISMSFLSILKKEIKPTNDLDFFFIRNHQSYGLMMHKGLSKKYYMLIKGTIWASGIGSIAVLYFLYKKCIKK